MRHCARDMREERGGGERTGINKIKRDIIFAASLYL